MQSPWASWKAGVMVLTAVAGVALGAIGYRAPRLQTSLTTSVAASSAGSAATVATAAADPKPSASATGSAQATPSASAHPATASATGKAAAASTTAAATASATSQPAASAPGPLLSQTQYAQFALQIYPGTPSAAASQALSGFQLSFKSLGGGEEQISITANGQTQTAKFKSTDKLYFIETRMGDDGFGQDNNFGDDGFILTDAGGHIVGQ